MYYSAAGKIHKARLKQLKTSEPVFPWQTLSIFVNTFKGSGYSDHRNNNISSSSNNNSALLDNS
jgi:hypothetical protein